MARSKYLQPLDKRENKMKKKMGHPGEEMSYGHHGIEFTNKGPVWTSRPRIGVDTRIRSKTSSNSGNWLHAVGFVVLAAIVISSGGKLVIDVASPAPSETCCVVA